MVFSVFVGPSGVVSVAVASIASCCLTSLLLHPFHCIHHLTGSTCLCLWKVVLAPVLSSALQGEGRGEIDLL